MFSSESIFSVISPRQPITGFIRESVYALFVGQASDAPPGVFIHRFTVNGDA